MIFGCNFGVGSGIESIDIDSMGGGNGGTGIADVVEPYGGVVVDDDE